MNIQKDIVRSTAGKGSGEALETNGVRAWEDKFGFLLAALPYGCGFAFVYSRGMLPNLCTVFLGGSLCWVSFCLLFV